MLFVPNVWYWATTIFYTRPLSCLQFLVYVRPDLLTMVTAARIANTDHFNGLLFGLHKIPNNKKKRLRVTAQKHTKSSNTISAGKDLGCQKRILTLQVILVSTIIKDSRHTHTTTPRLFEYYFSVTRIKFTILLLTHMSILVISLGRMNLYKPSHQFNCMFSLTYTCRGTLSVWLP